MAISQELLNILACPKCKGKVCLDEERGVLICDKCRLCYEIKEGIPIMLVEEAMSINEISSA